MNQGLPNIFKQLRVRTKVRLMFFWKPNNSIEGKCGTFSVHQEISKTCLVYLEFQLHRNIFGGCF